MAEKISVPIERSYYRARRGSDRLLCWLPSDELRVMIGRNEASADALTDFPSGLETVVEEDALAEYEIVLGLDADALTRAFGFFSERGAIAQSGRVSAADLHKRIRDAMAAHPGLSLERALERSSAHPRPLKEPAMSDGTDDARQMMQSF